MRREFSAGGIVLRQAQDKFSNNKWEVLLIHNMAMRDPKKSYWGFPKGHIDKGESSKDAAIREVKEEVGLEVEIIEKIGESKYVFTKDREKVFKAVAMFLMKASDGEVKVLEEELMDAQWFSPVDALEKLSFKQDKDLLSLAIERIK